MPKSTDAWMPLYWGDYLRDTPHLTTTQHGAYLLLIGAYWSHGPLPDDPTALASITRLSESEWQRHRQTLSKFFSIADGMWHHKRIDTERAKAIKLKEVRSKAGLSGAAMRWPTSNRMANASVCDEVATPFATTPSPSPSPSPLQETKNQEPRVGGASAAPSPNDSPKPLSSKGNGHDRGSRGTRLAADWKPSIQDCEFAGGLGLEADEVAAGFRDYWIACPGRRGVKLDWAATWRNWCRREAARGGGPGGNGPRNQGVMAAGRRAVARLAERDRRLAEASSAGSPVDDADPAASE